MLREWERPLSFDAIVRWGADLFVKEGVSIHLWFVYMILLLYLFIPFISKILKTASRKTIVVFLVLWLILNHLQIFGVVSIDEFPLLFKRLYGYMLYTGYLVLGYFLQTLHSKYNLSRISALLLYLSTVVIASLLTYYLSSQSGKQTLTAMNTFTLNTFAQVIAIYFLVKNIEFKNKYLVGFIQTVSNYSFGIYLVHIMVISLFFRVGIFWTMAHPLISVPIVVLLALIASFIVIFLLRKIPFMAKFAG
jgi:surface polysaccharide O-acyltransferase-like enzyme